MIVRLGSIDETPFAFSANISEPGEGDGMTLDVTGPDPATGMPVQVRFHLRARSHNAYLDVFEAIARRFGTRVPRNRRPTFAPAFLVPYQPLITRNLSPDVTRGYGDPAVIRVPDDAGREGTWYYMVATSNDAADSFPISRSRDLHAWSHVGFVFPHGHKPLWAADGAGVSDYWAPEMHRVGEEYRVYFVARERESHHLSIGLATAPRPDGPFGTLDAPILRGDVIDPNLTTDAEGSTFLFWKEDANAVWPSRLNQMLHQHGRLIEELFAHEADRRTASLIATLWPWVRRLEPMERFFVHQVLLEAVTADFAGFQRRLDGLVLREGDASIRRAAQDVRDVMRTPIRGQRLAADGATLIGERVTVLENDQDWEAHLIEGVWVTRQQGRYYLFYAGNDFSTADYGIGVAVADAPLGPYRKMPERFLRSTAEWWGPGHPSVTEGPDGEPWLILHAFFPGRTGYNEFRAVLAVPIAFESDHVRLR